MIKMKGKKEEGLCPICKERDAGYECINCGRDVCQQCISDENEGDITCQECYD